MNILKSALRIILNFIGETISFFIGIATSIFLFKAGKKLRIRICILKTKENKSLASSEEVKVSLDRMNLTLKEKFNTAVVISSIKIIDKIHPDSALATECSSKGFRKIESGEAGNFFSKFTTTLSLTYPITVFIVESITNEGHAYGGCSFGLATNYLLLTPLGLKEPVTFAHEIAHCCWLQHDKKKENLMFPLSNRGTEVTSLQNWLFRNSRHVNYL